ncbi:hypothetical protein KAI87_15270, partial [Myxococcota bacterium]|nr:hypothetical protein [Myxococcota bacterium]
MSKIGIDTSSAVQNRTLQQDPQSADSVKQKPKDLHAASTFEKAPKSFSGIGQPDLSAIAGTQSTTLVPALSEIPRSEHISLKGGKVIELPRLSEKQEHDSQALLSSAGDQNRLRLEEASLKFGQALLTSPDDIPGDLVTTTGALQVPVDETYEVYMTTTGIDERSDATSEVMLMGLSGIENGLSDFYKEIVGKENTATEVEAEAQELAAMLEDWPDDGTTETFTYHETTINDDGTLGVIEHKDVELSKAEATALLSKLNGQVDGISALTQRDFYELQNLVQKFQQAMNIMSNILKNQ